MIQSNYEFLRTSKTLRPPVMVKRVRCLENQVTQLREYLQRACTTKKATIKAIIVRYESLADEIQSKLDKEILQ